MNIPIIFENTHVVVIDKPVGIIAHPDGRQEEYTVANWMKDTYSVAGVGDAGREGIVHRIDRETTGLLILAKDQIAFTTLKKQFHDHLTRKVYRAIVEGHIRHETGMISLPLARAKSDFRKRTVVDMFSDDMRGEEREAITRYKVLETVTKDDKAYSYVEVYPLTGRTHQIRAHFRGIRHPIIGDDLYGSLKGKDIAPRSMLHAHTLTIEIPKDNEGFEKKTFVAQVPEDMKKILVDLGFSKTLEL
ncbi:MAG: RluA family pseudouridine synthase [Candidatus Pacebacteria bacterium]|nr:RluA family pseudouridine synthase [Candidatus Paceibacterota bacterium]